MKLRQISFKIVSMIMVLAMMFGICATTVSAQTLVDKAHDHVTEKYEQTLEDYVQEIIDAYENKHHPIDAKVDEAINKAIELVNAVQTDYKKVYAEEYQKLVDLGAIDYVNYGLDVAEKTLEDLHLMLGDYDVEYPELQGTYDEIIHQITLAADTIAAVRPFVNYADHDAIDVADVWALLEKLQAHADQIIVLGEELEIVVDNNLPEAVETATDFVEYINGEVEKHIEEQVTRLYGEFVDAVTKIIEEDGEKAVLWALDWLNNNKVEILKALVEDGQEILAFVVENQDYIFGVIGFFAADYDSKLVNFVMDNAALVLPAIAGWMKDYAHDARDLIVVYAEAMFKCLVTLDGYDAVKVHVVLSDLIDLLGELAVELGTDVSDKIDRDHDAIVNLVGDIEKKAHELRPILVQAGKDFTMDLCNDVYNYVYALVRDYVELVVNSGALEGEFTPSADTNFVSVNGGSAEYAEILAGVLSNEDFQINPNYTIWGEIDYDMLAAADLITIGYDENELSAFAIDQLLAYLSEYIRVDLNDSINAYVEDVITTIADAHNILNGEKFDELVTDVQDYVTNTINSEIINNIIYPLPTTDPVEFDWAKLVGEENVALVDEALAIVRAELINVGIVENHVESFDMLDFLLENENFADFIDYIDIDVVRSTLGEKANYNLVLPVVDSIMFAAEAFIYSYVEFQVEYAKLLVELNEINPDATVVLLGHYNAFDFDLEIAGSTINLSPVYSCVSAVSGITPLAFALAYPNVCFVDISDAETKYDVLISEDDMYKSIEMFLLSYLLDPEITDVSEAGNEYIANQILDVLTIGCAHHYDNACDAICNWCGFEREVAGHVYDGPCDEICNICGFEREGAGHTYNSNACDARCIVCGHRRGSGQHKIADCTVGICIFCGEFLGTSEHVFDGCEDKYCRNCDYEREAGKHVYIDCDDVTCEACGQTRVAVQHQYDNACDANCNVCNKAREVAGHVYSGCEDTDCNVCGLTREAGKHVTSDCVDTECDLCGYPVLAKGHSFGAWSVTKEATRKVEGTESRICSACKFTETRSIPVVPGMGPGAIVAITLGSVVVAGAAGFAIYWFAIQKKTFAHLLEVFSKPAEVSGKDAK